MSQSNIQPGPACLSAVSEAPAAITPRHSERAAVVLAGGDGMRLGDFTREMFGEEIPKQFCKFWGKYDLLEQTRRRAALLIDPARTITVLTETHSRFYSPLLESMREEHVAIQPFSRGTAPAILYALMRLNKLAPNCSVAMFPSDHFVDDDRRFMRHVEAAFRAADARPQTTVLLGVEPAEPNTQYGWIEPGELLADECEPIRSVRCFWEKPALPIARQLIEIGCFWNTFVIVSRLSSFLGLFSTAMPELCETFNAIKAELGTPAEASRLRRLYRDIGASNFSDEALVKHCGNLAVLPVKGVRWDDLGDPGRLAKLIERRRRLDEPLRFGRIERAAKLLRPPGQRRKPGRALDVNRSSDLQI